MQSACAWLHAIKPELRGKLDAGTFVAAAATAALTISLYFLFKPAIVPRLFIIYLHFDWRFLFTREFADMNFHPQKNVYWWLELGNYGT